MVVDQAKIVVAFTVDRVEVNVHADHARRGMHASSNTNGTSWFSTISKNLTVVLSSVPRSSRS